MITNLETIDRLKAIKNDVIANDTVNAILKSDELIQLLEDVEKELRG